MEACGASGGNGSNGKEGGRGAKVSGNVWLTKGEKLIVLVGQRGSSQSGSRPGSGGGGTFVISQTGPLLVAGGGGGGASKMVCPEMINRTEAVSVLEVMVQGGLFV